MIDPDAVAAGRGGGDGERRAEVRRTQRTYYLVNSLGWFANVLPMAVSVLLAQARGLSLFDVGIYTGAYTLTVAVLEVPTGGLADTIGRKRTALLSHLLALVAMGIFLVAFSLPTFLAYALVHGASRALGSGALQAWFVDSLQEVEPGIDLQPPLALASTFELLALAAATLLGGALPTLFADLSTGGPAGLTPLAVPFLASVVVNGATICAVAILVRERSPTRAGGATGVAPGGLARVVRDALATTRGNPVVLLLLGTGALNGIALIGVETFWQPFFADRLNADVGDTWIFGVILAGCFGAGMLGNLTAIGLTRLFGRRYARVAILFAAIQIVALVLLAGRDGVVGAVGLLWLAYFAMGGSESPLATLFNLEVPASLRSVMLSVQSLAGFAGAFAGSLGLGWIAGRTSIGTAWLVAGVLVGGTILLLARIDRRRASAPRGDVHPGT